MSGQVQTITYIMLSTAPTYETSDMCSFFSLLLDDKLEDNLKWIVSRVLPNFQSCMSKHLSTFLRYFLCDKYNLPMLQSICIFISKIIMVAPKSFISYSPLNRSFKLLISNMFLDIINMSSTDNNKYTNEIYKCFMKHTQMIYGWCI